jgi:hypothetical protein
MRLMDEGEPFYPNIYYATFVTNRSFWISSHLGEYCWEGDVYFNSTKRVLLDSLPPTLFRFELTEEELIEHVVLEII